MQMVSGWCYKSESLEWPHLKLNQKQSIYWFECSSNLPVLLNYWPFAMVSHWFLSYLSPVSSCILLPVPFLIMSNKLCCEYVCLHKPFGRFEMNSALIFSLQISDKSNVRTFLYKIFLVWIRIFSSIFLKSQKKYGGECFTIVSKGNY